MRVTYVLPVASGGLGRHVHSLVASLVSRGLEVHVVAPDSTEERFRFGQLDAEVLEVDIGERPSPARDANAVLQLRRALRGGDVVHAHGLRAGGLAAIALTGGSHRRLVVTLHNAVVEGGAVGAAYRTLEWLVDHRAAVVLAVSPDLAERARRHHARAVETAVIAAPAIPPPAADRDAVRERLGLTGRRIVVAVGRLAPQKGPDVLLDAAARWAAMPDPPIVLVVGDGPLRPGLEKRIASEGLPVRLLGERDDVADLLAAADVTVLPSLWEGQPLALQEMLRAGKAIVATRVGGVPSMVGDAAILVPPGDPAALSEALLRALDDGGLRATLESAATIRGARLPTEDDAVEHVLGIYRRLLER
jgi:glycosyltransferase involved in cell wall biosynthesis